MCMCVRVHMYVCVGEGESYRSFSRVTVKGGNRIEKYFIGIRKG